MCRAADFLRKAVPKLYPDLEKQVQITLIEAGKTLLSSFDQRLSDYTMRTFRKRNIDVRTSVSGTPPPPPISMLERSVY